MQARLLGLILLLGTATGAVAEDMKMPVNASQIKWGPAPDFIPKGALGKRDKALAAQVSRSTTLQYSSV